MESRIRDASTVLALRDAPEGLEVFVVRRSSRLEFLGGVHAFPGGAVDDGDRDAGLDGFLTGFDAAAASADLRVESVAHARGFLVAAIRELFEEAGVLLARDERAAWADTTGPSNAGRVAGAATVVLAPIQGAEICVGVARPADQLNDRATVHEVAVRRIVFIAVSHFVRASAGI